jgi:hypothetical protein
MTILGQRENVTEAFRAGQLSRHANINSHGFPDLLTVCLLLPINLGHQLDRP